MPMHDGLVLHTLHDMREITDPGELFGDLPHNRPDKEMVSLATQLIDRQTSRFAPEDMEDRYEARLRAVIEAKLKGLPPEPDPEPEDRGNVVDLMAALRRSLGEDAPRPRATARSKAGANAARKTSPAKSAKTPAKTPAKPAAKTSAKPPVKPPAKAPAKQKRAASRTAKPKPAPTRRRSA
jgi:DNA end-binding protein Ku